MTVNARAPRARRRAGFSLVELMTVVVITGVLAAIAIPTFQGYIFKSRTSEAVHFLGVIKLKQESFRAEFGSYAPAPGGQTKPAQMEYTPAIADMHGATKDFDPVPAAFTTLGAVPQQDVRFAYGYVSGSAVDAASAGLDSAPYNYVLPFDMYFIAQAVSDLNNNGVACTYEITSFTRQLWYTPARGWD